jgi:hypothetical protein
MIKVEKVKEALNLHSFGAKGWMTNRSINCPECGRAGKFGFKFDKKGGAVHCFFCDHSQNIYKYLRSINRKDLISNDVEISLESGLKNIKRGNTPEEEKEDVKEVNLPRGFKRIYDDEYLNDRGWLPEHYEEYEVGYTKHFLEKKLHGYLIFSIFQEGKRVSWLARTKHNYQWHKENIMAAKEGKEKLMPRYRNSDGTEFDEILGGSDKITENTHTVILVEGMMDAINTDNILGLNETEEVKCCFTFGNKVSDNQINILRNKKSVATVILMYDEGTIKQSKTYGLKLCKYYETFITLNKNPDVDPGNMDLRFAINLLKHKQPALEFYLNVIERKSYG